MTRKISTESVAVPPSGRAPEKRPLEGKLVLLEPLDPDRHSEALYSASHENEEAKRVWTFLPDGPFEDIASFRQWATRMVMEADRLFFAVRDKRA